MARARSPTHLCFWATWQFILCVGRDTYTVKQGSSSSQEETSSPASLESPGVWAEGRGPEARASAPRKEDGYSAGTGGRGCGLALQQTEESTEEQGILPGLSTEENELCSHTVASGLGQHQQVSHVTPSSQHLNYIQVRLSLP